MIVWDLDQSQRLIRRTCNIKFIANFHSIPTHFSVILSCDTFPNVFGIFLFKPSRTLALVGRLVFSYTMKTIHQHFFETTTHVMEVAASVQPSVILDQSYYFIQARCHNHVVVFEVNFLTAAVTLIMGEGQR